MAQCQKCSAALEGDFGVVNCTQCGEVNFLDEGPAASPAPKWQVPPIAPPVSSREKTKVVENTNAKEVFKEITDFGNQINSTAETGVLLYEVQISGIDTLELRKAVVEDLRDSKFKWDADELEQEIKNGVLIIRGLTPIKASVLIKKLRHLDVDIHWTQGSVYENHNL